MFLKFSIPTYNLLRITKSSLSRSTIWANIFQLMAFGCVVPCSTMQIVCDKINQNEVNTFWRILPDWFVPNKSYTVLFFHRVILLGWIQDLTKGGSDKRPPKAIVPRVVRSKLPGILFLILGPLKCDFQRFQGQLEVV